MFMNGFLMYHKQGFEALSSFEDYQTDLSNQVFIFLFFTKSFTQINKSIFE